MKQAFYGSLCYHGIRGGAICVRGGFVIYATKTLTLPQAYRNIRIPIGEIQHISCGRKLLLPVVHLCLKDQTRYSFVVFCRKRFLRLLEKTP